MTIYFKDGSSLNVSKIVFRQNLADLYLPDGTMRTFAVDKIDIKSSGIPRAEGTYGQTRLTPSVVKRPEIAKPLTGDPKFRQIQLKEEWDHADRSATALNDVGPIHHGDLVKISNESTAGSITENETAVETPDGAYLVIYVSGDGLFGKKLFDAASFQSNFKLNEKQLTPPEPIIIPPKPSDTQKEPVQHTKPVVVRKPVEHEPKDVTPEEKPNLAVKQDEQSFPILPVSIAAGGILLTGAALFVYLRKKRKVFLNVTKFKQFEDELRDFELEIWLKHGRTMDQLMEIGTKKFYQDQPNPLAIAMKMLKGADRLSMVHSIARLGGLSSEGAGEVYAEMHQRMEWICETIKAVSARTGFAPLEQPNPLLSKTGPHIRKEIQSAAEIARSSKKQEISDPEISPPQIIPIQSDRQFQSSSAGLPAYLKNVLKHLDDLSE